MTDLNTTLERVMRENVRLEKEIENWKNASNLEYGGDPDAVTPDSMRKYWDKIICENGRLKEIVHLIIEIPHDRLQKLSQKARSLLTELIKKGT